MMKSLIYILFVFLVQIHSQGGFGITPNSYKASDTTTYTIIITMGNSTHSVNVQSGALSALVLPADYAGRLVSSNIPCTITGWETLPTPSPTCSLSGSSIYIENLFTINYSFNSFQFSINLPNILNPATAVQTGSFYYQVYATDGTITMVGSGLTIQPALMSCFFTTAPTSTGQANGKMLVQFQTPEFFANSTITINFELGWPQTLPILSNNIISDINNVNCLSGTSPSISCEFNIPAATSYVGIVSNIVSTNVKATNVTFSIGPITTPPNTMPQGTIYLQAKTNNAPMSSCSAAVSGMTPNSLSNVQYLPLSTTVNSLTQATLQFTINVNLQPTDTIIVTFPNEIQISPLLQYYISTTSSSSYTSAVSNQVVNITNASVQSGQTAVIIFRQTKNPSSESPTSTFSIYTSRNNYKMDELSVSFTFTATRTSINSASLGANNLQIGVITNYSLQFVIGQPLTSSSAIVVQLPTMYQGQVGGCSPFQCTVTTTKITFMNVTTAVGSLVTLTLLNVTNPLQIGPTTSLTLYTLYSSSQATSYVQYTNTGITVSLISRVIPSSNIFINSSSKVVSYTPVSFSFIITNVNALPANVYLQISLPAQVRVASGQINCQVGSSSISCSYDSSTRMVTFSSISSSAIGAGQLASTTVVISNLVNPSSTSATSSFGVNLLNPLAQIIEYQSSGLTFTATQAANFYSLSLVTSNAQNSAPTSLSVSFTITAASYVNSSLFAINFPSLINIQNASCTPVSSNLISVSCMPNSNKLQALLLYNSLDTTKSTQFTVSNFLNYPSLQPYTITVDLFQDVNQLSKLYSNSASPANFQNQFAGSITVSSSSFTNTILAASTNLNIQISATNGASFSYLSISIPYEFGISGIGCSLPSGTSCTLQSTNLIINSSTVVSLPLIFTINNITAPSFSPSSNIYIQTFSSSNYLMDSNTQVFFTTSCTLPCRTCSTPTTTCLSCYTNPSLVAGQIYFNTSNCVSVCGNGYYLDSVISSCTLCPTPCATCLNSSICYTCTSSFLYNNSCLVNCPFGYYGFNGLCLVCSTAIFCESCPNSLQCSTCISGYFYYNYQCYVSCIPLITYANLVNRTCDSCPNNCNTCQGNSSNLTCLTCVAGYVMDSGRCYLTCQTSGLIAVNSVCQGCTSPCSSCSLTVTNCTACLTSGSSPYLYQFRCLSRCPDGFYSQISTVSCNPCTNPCQLCLNVSVRSCVSCITNYYLYQFECLSNCPSGTFNTSGKCDPCNSPCVTCSDATTCKSCTANTYLYNGQCVNLCPVGMTIINGNQCLVCASTCKTCSSSTFCTSCNNSTYLYNGTCSANCPSATFANTTTFVCDSCISPCSNCQSTTYCLSCLDVSKFLVNGDCVPCTSPCASCSISITNCTSCLSSTPTPYIFNFSCLNVCPYNYYSDSSTRTCILCVSPCLTCNGSSNSSCLSCIGGYYLLLNLCYTICPATYYPNVSVCTSCQSPCATCSSNLTCLSCITNFYLYGSSCVNNCSSGMVISNNSICTFCDAACKSCLSSNASVCTSCYSGAYLNQNNQTCSSGCPNGFYPDSSSGNGLCAACSSPCSYCNSATYCLSCLDANLFLVNGLCLGCLSPCLTCSSLRTNCTSCDSSSANKYLYSATCNTGCQFGYYPDVSMTCKSCTSPCASCTNASTNACLTCINGYYQLNTTCYATCPNSFYPNATICSSCLSPCQTCSDKSTCLSCISNYYLFGSNCIDACPNGTAIINGTICQYCSSSCKTCQSSNSSSCTSCYTTTYLNGNTCISSCPGTTFADNTTNICQPCVSPCLLCQSLTFCLSCLDVNKFLIGGSCIGCTSPCVTCLNTTNTCTSCSSSTGYPYLLNSSCVNTCPGGYYGQSSTNRCYTCVSPCQTCTSASLNNCLSCVTNYLFLSGSCLLACPNSYYSNNITCIACQSPCQNCIDNSTCTSCQGGKLLQGAICVDNCSTGLTSVNNTYCSYCTGSCYSCLSSNTSACTSCYPGAYLLVNICYVICPAAYFADSTSSKCLPCQSPCDNCTSATLCLSCQNIALFLVNSSCVGCLSPCLTCQMLRTNCTACDAASGFPYLASNLCFASCPANTYSSSSSCLPCVSPCSSCLNASTSTCQTCVTGYVLHNSNCLLGCPAGYYSNSISCIVCASPCATCSSSNVCLSCIATYYLLGSMCTAACPGGMIVSNTTNGGVCAYCSSSCSTCLSTNTTYCTSCAAPTYLYLGACLTNCSIGFYANNVTFACNSCASPCATCISPTQCLSCVLSSNFLINFDCYGCAASCLTCSGTINTCTSCNTSGTLPYYFQNRCINNCPDTYYNDASFNCTPCASPCSTCSAPGNLSCLTCLGGYLKLANTCYVSCPGGYYNLSNSCVACDSPCFTCFGPGTAACLSCTSGLYLQGSTCVSNCSGMAVSGNQCVFCASSCLTCLQTNNSYCTSCNGLFLYSGSCVSSCVSGYYPDTNLSACVQCLPPCAMCSSPTACISCLLSSTFLVGSSCLSCQFPCLTCSTGINVCASCNTSSTNRYFYQSNCLSGCPSTYYNDASFNCTKCASPCDTCSGAGNQTCVTCLSGYLQLNAICYISCPGGYYNFSGICLPCTAPCFTCFGPGTAACLSCTSGLYLQGSTCVSNCSGMAVSGNQCVFCASSCLTCNSTNNSYCTSCNGLFLYSGSCVSSCVSGYYPDTNLSACVQCLPPCAMCSSPTACISCLLSSTFLVGSSCLSCQFPCLTCSTGITVCASCNTSSSTNRYFYQSNCLSDCPSTYYNDASFNCTKCASPCYTCSGAGNQTCVTCLSGYLQLNASCYVSCPGGYYNLSGFCLLCTAPCFTCFGPGTAACLQCTSGLYLQGSTCVSNCSGMAVSGNQCVFCVPSCLTCLSTDNSYCTSCNGLFLYSGSCVSSCVIGYYSDALLSQCMPCLYPCATCSSSTSCLSCMDSTKFLLNSACIGCSSPCLTCSLSINNCTSCDSLSGNPFLLNFACLSSCSPGYYQQTTSKCTACTSPCASCTASGVNSCSACISNTYLLATTCYSVCPTGYFINIAMCSLCVSPCSSCQITNSTCTSCITGYFLRGSSCVTNCSVGEIVVNNSFCQVCNNNCLTCVSTNFSYCTSCQNGSYLSSGTCVASCQNTSYANSTHNLCVACIHPCLTCTSQSQCTSCVVTTLFLINFSCQSCLSPCYTCIGSQTNCTSCDTSSTRPFYFGSGCLANCPAGYYDGGSFNCLACILPCSTCTAGNNRSCINCTNGYSQLGTDCYSTCPSGYYSNGTSCLPCNNSLCLTCTLSASTCLSCISGLYLLGSACQNSCPSGMIILNNSICSSCTSNCMTCLTVDTSYCTSCLSNNYLFNGLCNTSCPNQYYSDAWGNCIRCSSPCSTCQSLTSCLSCIDLTLFLQNKTCVSTCSYPLIGINASCYRCASQCLTCTQTVSTCLLCATGFYYYPSNFTCSLYCSYYVLPQNISSSGNNQCTQTCPTGTYTDNSTKYCVACPSICKVCSNSTSCSQCSTGYNYYSSFCYSSCPTSAPYAINGQCIMCNIGNCQTCQNTTYCKTCISNYLLIAVQNTSASSCISSCPSGKQYNQSILNCVYTVNPTQVSNIVQSVVPPYTFLISSSALTFLSFIIKFKYPAANLPLTLFLAIQLTSCASIVNLLTIQISNSGIAQGNFAQLSVSTYILLSSVGIQVLSSLGAILAILKIRDKQLVKIWISNPITFVAIMILSAVDSNMAFLTTTQIMDVACFQAKLTSDSMTKVFIFGLVSTIISKGLNAVYSATQLLFYSSNAHRLLATVNYPIQKSCIIEFIVITAVCICFVVYLICSMQKQQKTQDSKQQSHQSLIDESKAFDKRNESNAQILMSVDNSDLMVDINSLKDEKQISSVDNSNFLFQQGDSHGELKPPKKRLKAKKVTPDQMLKQMNDRIEEESETNMQGLQKMDNVFFAQQDQEDEKQLQDNNNFNEGNNKDERRDDTLLDITDNLIDNNQTMEKIVLIAENTIEVISSPSKLADISEITYREGEDRSKSNIFDGEQFEEPNNEKTKTEVIKVVQQHAGSPKKQKYSPSELSKYKPNENIVNQFAQNSYLDDAMKFHEHQFEHKINQIEVNPITFEQVNDNYDQQHSIEQISFQKRQKFVQPDLALIQPQRLSKQELKQRQDQQIVKILEEQEPKYNIVRIEEEDEYKERQTPSIKTPITNSFFEEQQELHEFMPSQGLKGKKNRRSQHKKPDIPLPKNEIQKQIMNIYHLKKDKKESKRKRYPDIPLPKASKNSNYIDYELQDQQFVQESNVPKPIFSNQMKRQTGSRYHRSINSGSGQGSAYDEDMPVKPSINLRKSSFKKVGEMVMESQNSARK